MKNLVFKQSGIQLIEIIIAMAVISLLAVVAIPSYSDYRDKADDATAAIDIQSISQKIISYYIDNHRYPDSLADVNLATQLDPWKNPYHYLRINGAGLTDKSILRKDKSLVPINTDFDLYSSGKNGNSMPPLTAKSSQDDIIRANNGKYIGLASDY